MSFFSVYKLILATIFTGLFLNQNSDAFFLNTPPNPKKKIITISPSGLRGYYLLGIASYLKDHFVLKDYVFSGSSAGSWISLIMSYRGDHRRIIQDVLETSERNKQSIRDLGKGLKHMFLNSGKYKDRDFDLNACYMGLIDVNMEVHPMTTSTFIYNNFTTLEDAINCCIASSHVPFVMGRDAFRKYKGRHTIDGGFSNNPYYGLGHIDGNCVECTIDKTPKPAELHIHPFIWYKRPVYVMEFMANQFRLFMELFTISSMNFTKVYQEGYQDAKKHHANFANFRTKPPRL